VYEAQRDRPPRANRWVCTGATPQRSCSRSARSESRARAAARRRSPTRTLPRVQRDAHARASGQPEVSCARRGALIGPASSVVIRTSSSPSASINSALLNHLSFAEFGHADAYGTRVQPQPCHLRARRAVFKCRRRRTPTRRSMPYRSGFRIPRDPPSGTACPTLRSEERPMQDVRAGPSRGRSSSLQSRSRTRDLPVLPDLTRWGPLIRMLSGRGIASRGWWLSGACEVRW
jgi:hypothetical protein